MATSPELKEALKSAADKIAKYVEDAATMTVETRFIDIGEDASQSKLAARTTVKLDGDSETILAMKKSPEGIMAVDSMIHEAHQTNVQAAIDYRTGMLERLLGLLTGH